MVLMSDTKVIARKIVQKDKWDSFFQLEAGVTVEDVPDGLFMNGKTETWDNIMSFFKLRVFPKERCGAEELLDELGLDRYDAWDIAKKTRGTLMTDPWWMKIKDTDTYETHSLRGLAGIKPFHWDERPKTMCFGEND